MKTSHLIRKLEQFTRLSADDKAALERVSSVRIRRVRPRDRPREDIIHEGDRPSQVSLILEGWACRYKHLENGRRQIRSAPCGWRKSPVEPSSN